MRQETSGYEQIIDDIGGILLFGKKDLAVFADCAAVELRHSIRSILALDYADQGKNIVMSGNHRLVEGVDLRIDRTSFRVVLLNVMARCGFIVGKMWSGLCIVVFVYRPAQRQTCQEMFAPHLVKCASANCRIKPES
jgi:hypothetical protein